MRIIDAEEFKHRINCSDLYGTDVWEGVLDMLAECKTVDAVSVTRCKDCKYRTQEQIVKISKTDPQCIWFLTHRNENGFCHFGEKNEAGYE